MRIEQIHTCKKKYLELLLLADEQESMIDRYLDRGDMFVMYAPDGEAVCSAVITGEGDDTCELKSLAVKPPYQRQGYGRRMVDFLCQYYAERFSCMTVGTGDSVRTVSFYTHCGFRYSHAVPDFFTAHYDHPIVEDGKTLKDMLYFRRALAAPCLVCKPERTNVLISSLLDLWEGSVRASHDFLGEKDIENLIPEVRKAIEVIETLVVLFQNKKPVGFIGIEQRKIEMLFVSAECFGCGFGTTLVNMAVKEYECIWVDVNEQNPKAWKFYEHMGFHAVGRTETDGQGNPFPIVQLRKYE